MKMLYCMIQVKAYPNVLETKCFVVVCY